MGIRFECPNGHKLHVKTHLAGKRGICPDCGAKFVIPPTANGHAEHERSDSAVSAGKATLGSSRDALSPEASAVIRIVDDRQEVATEPVVVVPPPSAEFVGPPILQPRSSLWYVRPPGGGQFGPATEEVFKGWIAEGRVTEDASLWREGWPEWKLARDAADALPIPLPFVVASIPIAVPAGPDEPASAEPIRAEVVGQELEQASPGQESSASQAVYRTLNRRVLRKQQRRKFAVILLVATIVLAALFTWILLRNPPQESTARRAGSPIQLAQICRGPYVAIADRST